MPIENKKDMLLRYAREHHFPNPTFFVDDGVSGVTYDRPGFQAMLAEIEAGRVAVCISKDLSRLGRNSALTVNVPYGYLKDPENPYDWHSSTVVAILERREYTGCMVYFKTFTNSI